MAVGVQLLFVGEWILDEDVSRWARGPAAVALAVEAVASAVLLTRRLTLLPRAGASPAARPPVGWLITACAAGTVLAVCALAVRNYGLWAVAPATVVAIVATYLAPRARRPLIIASVLCALLPGGVVSLATGDGESVHAALFPAGLVAFTVWVVLGPVVKFPTSARRAGRAASGACSRCAGRKPSYWTYLGFRPVRREGVPGVGRQAGI
ncbi:hypothetical protein [Streptomyces sp. NPDC127119]|uniref:hypothetical protein n=1 Tax=Streptomyces sp. NPDC127119 TaxID=3345370 RepID=UPI0036381AD5